MAATAKKANATGSTRSSQPDTPQSSAAQSPPVTQHSPTPRVRVVLELDVPLFDLYEEQAIARGLMPEALLAERLQRCVGYTATQPLYINDDQRRKLSETIGHNLQNVDVLIAQVTQAIKVKVGDVEVDVPARTLQRLPSRVFRGETLEKVIKREVNKALEIFVGLRPA